MPRAPVLAYLFWHRPRDAQARDAYELDALAFHRSLERSPPVGLRGSAIVRVQLPSWLGWSADGGAAYEDWYLLEDWAAVGVLGEAAVGRGHRSAHERIARRAGEGAGAMYALLEGGAPEVSVRAAALGVWVSPPAGPQKAMLGELLADGVDPARASLWRRALVLGPAPEFCVLAPEAPAGAAPARLPAGWSAAGLAREPLTG